MKMQSFAASSNSTYASFSRTHVHQWGRSTVGHSPLTNIEMPHQPDFCHGGKIVDKPRHVPSAHMTMARRQKYLDFNGGVNIEEIRMNQCSDVEMQVRDNELDQYGVFNNAVYLSYCQHGHQKLLKKVGLGADLVAKADETTTMSDLSLKFFDALRSGDRFVVKTKISCISTTSIFVEDFIFRLPDQQLILEAKARIVLIDRNSQPVHISPGVKANLLMLDFPENCE